MYEFQKRESMRSGVLGGWWWRDPNEQKMDDRPYTVVICCPKCCRSGALDHTIHPDGRVEPSVVCPFPPCAFHEYVRLVDWTV